MSPSPTPKATSPWLDTIPDARRFDTLKSDVTTDVVIVGGGIVGIMTAWRLSQRGVKCVVLERNHVVTGDTAFTTAFITRVPDASSEHLKDLYGQPFLNRVYKATTAAQDWFKQTIVSEGIACDYKELASYNCAYEEDDEDLQAEWSVIKEADPKAKFITGAEAGVEMPAIKEAIRFDGEARYHVRKFLIGLLQRPDAKNITIYEECEVTDIAVGKTVVVTTTSGRVTANKVIVTTGRPHDSFKELQSLLTTRLTFVIGATFNGKMPIGDAMFWDTEDPYQYFRRFDDHTMILGGADRDAVGDIPSSLAKPHEYLQKFADRMFGKDYTVKYTWSGSLFETEDGLPFLSEHPHYPGKVFIGTGFSGNGMVCGALAGLVLSDLVTGTANEYADIFSFSRIKKPIPKPAPRPRKPLLERLWVKRSLQVLLPLIYIAVLVIPAQHFFALRGGVGSLKGLDTKGMAGMLFPLIGLYAFFLVWAQLMIGSMMPILRKVYKKIELFHRFQGVFALLFGLTHPIMIMIALGLSTYLSFVWTDRAHLPYIILGEIQLFLLCLTAMTALAMRLPWLRERWHVIHYCNYVLFGLAWIHAWNLGSDLVNGGSLRGLWIFFAVTGGIAVLVRIARALGFIGNMAVTSGTAMSGAWVRVAKESQLVVGKPFRVMAAGSAIALIKLPDGIFAINNVCGHAGGPLDEGSFEQYFIECPWHGSKFDVRTGQVIAGPATRAQQVYKTKVENGEVSVQM